MYHTRLKKNITLVIQKKYNTRDFKKDHIRDFLLCLRLLSIRQLRVSFSDIIFQ